MAALKAILTALSLLVIAVFYSDIIENETELSTQETVPDQTKTIESRTATGAIGWDVLVSDHLLSGESGSFQSPNYPIADHKLDCMWLIRVSKPNTIRLVLLDFDTEAGYDYILVHDGDSPEHPLLLVHSGQSIPPTVRSTGHQMLVRFVTNNKISSRGFQANYFSVPPCFNAVHSSSGHVTSPNYPLNYDSNLRCDWLISVGQSEKILFEFMDVNTEEDYDVIQIYNGDSDKSPFLRRISGDRRDEVFFVMSTSNVALIRFTTDASVSKQGFAVKFTAGNEIELLQHIMTQYPDLVNDLDTIKKTIEDQELDVDDIFTMADVTSLYQEMTKVNNDTMSSIQ